MDDSVYELYNSYIDDYNKRAYILSGDNSRMPAVCLEIINQNLIMSVKKPITWAWLMINFDSIRKRFNSSNSKVISCELNVTTPKENLIITSEDIFFNKRGLSLYALLNQIEDMLFWENYWKDDLFYDHKVIVTSLEIVLRLKHMKKGSNSRQVPLKDRVRVFDRDNYTCQMCGATVEDGAKLHIDHIIPVSKGGTNELDNLQTLCFECNLGKSDSLEFKKTRERLNEKSST